MRMLFFKERMAWPRSSGHDVHTFYMMQALARMGHTVSLATIHPADPRAIEGGNLASVHRLTGEDSDIPIPVAMSRWQERFRDYWGIPHARIREFGRLAEHLDADVVVVSGLNVLPYLADVKAAKRVWDAGDEWVWHHLSQLSMWKRSTWSEGKQAIVKGLYERAYAPLTDRVWMVSPADRKALRWVTGQKTVDVLPNGIDTDHFDVGDEPKTPRSCVFWGRLDFGPNIQALQWFCKKVWPKVRAKVPTARFNIYGFQPTQPVIELAIKESGIALIPDLPDIRADIRGHEVVVLPFVSGGGIKNKLLEAAAMAMPIVCTPRTMEALSGNDYNAVRVAPSAKKFASAIVELFADPTMRHTLGRNAREWVEKDCTWASAARGAEAGLEG